MELDLEFLQDIDSEFDRFAEEHLGLDSGLDIEYKDDVDMTPEECEKAFLDAIDRFPIPYDFFQTFYENDYMSEYPLSEFEDFLIGNFDIYFDYNRNLKKYLIHDSNEHDEWFKTTDAYKEIQKENAVFQEPAKNSSGHVIVYPGIIYTHCEPEYSRLPKLSPKDTEFKYLICTGRGNNVYLMDIGYGNTINPKEFNTKNLRDSSNSLLLAIIFLKMQLYSILVNYPHLEEGGACG